MKVFEVTVTVSDEKTFTVVAENEKEAREKTAQIYADTDLLDFYPEDLVPRITNVCELDDLEDEDFCDGDCEHCPAAPKEESGFFRIVQKKD